MFNLDLQNSPQKRALVSGSLLKISIPEGDLDFSNFGPLGIAEWTKLTLSNSEEVF